MLYARYLGKKMRLASDFGRLLSAIDSATQDANLLALNVALEGANAGMQGAAQLANAVGELSIRAQHFSHQIRGCVRGGGRKLDSRGLAELRRVTLGVAELMGEVSGLAGNALDSLSEPTVERKTSEIPPDLLDQVRRRAVALDRLLHSLPAVTRNPARN